MGMTFKSELLGFVLDLAALEIDSIYGPEILHNPEIDWPIFKAKIQDPNFIR